MEDKDSTRRVITEEEIIDSEPVIPVQKRYRFASGIFDIVLVVLLSFLLSRLFLISPLGNKYNENIETMMDIEDELKLKKLLPNSSETLGKKLYSYEEGYNENVADHKVHEDSVGKYIVVNYADASSYIIDAYKVAIEQNTEYMSLRKNAKWLSYATLVIPTAIAELIFIFIIPLFNKYRRSVGKLIFKFNIVNYNNFTPAHWWNIFIKYLFILILSAISLFFFTYLTALLIPLLIGISALCSKRNRCLHDIISQCYVVDGKTYSEERVSKYIESNLENE